jgi:hypothetical protein
MVTQMHYGLHKCTRAAVAKDVLILRATGLNCLLAGEVQSQVQDERSHEVEYTVHEKLSRISLLPYCDSIKLYRVSIKSSLITNIYYKKTTWNTNIFFSSKCNSPQEFFFTTNLSNGKKYDVFLTVHHSINLF